MSPKSHAFLNSSYGNLPEQLNHAGEQTLLIHPQDASMRGIAHGAVVRVFNDRGAFEAVATITDDLCPAWWLLHWATGADAVGLRPRRRLSMTGKYANLGVLDLLRQPGRGERWPRRR